MQETPVWSLGWEDLLDRLLTLVFLDFRCGSAGKESTRSAGDLSSIPGLGRSPGEGTGYPTHFRYSGLENFMDCIAHGVAKSRTGLSDFRLAVRWKCLRDYLVTPVGGAAQLLVERQACVHPR